MLLLALLLLLFSAIVSVVAIVVTRSLSTFRYTNMCVADDVYANRALYIINVLVVILVWVCCIVVCVVVQSISEPTMSSSWSIRTIADKAEDAWTRSK